MLQSKYCRTFFKQPPCIIEKIIIIINLFGGTSQYNTKAHLARVKPLLSGPPIKRTLGWVPKLTLKAQM